MRKKLEPYVIVLTGASSMIGELLAVSLCRQGATLLLGTSPGHPMDDLVTACRQAGGEAQAMEVDATGFTGIDALARHAVEAFGRIDVWINQHATHPISQTGRFDQLPMEELRRAIETGLLGTVHGARAALPVFYQQGYGLLINNAATPTNRGELPRVADIIARQGIRGLGSALRQEAETQGRKHIRISSILPATVDMPDRRENSAVGSRESQSRQIAEAVLACVLHPRREVFVGAAARTLRV